MDKKSEKDYNEILSMVTHDLKSPMTAVLSSFELLSLEDLSKKDKEETIKQGKKASMSMLKLIENILLMAKIEAGKESIEIKEIDDLDIRFQDILKTFKYEAKLKNIELKLNIKNTLPLVYWDMEKIQYHVINNIISNALKFTPKDGKISLKVEYKNKKIIIHIKDNGIGVHKSKLKNIFDKYETIEDKKVYKGHGLGLYNAHHFIKKHQGKITTTKGIEGKGVGFLIVLPVISNCL